MKSILVLEEHKHTLSKYHQGIQNRFRQHIKNHPNVIYDERQEGCKQFEGTLISFVEGLRYWKGQCILLRGDPMTDYGHIIESLLELPKHYLFLQELAKSFTNGEFKKHLKVIGKQWKEGKNFHYDATQLSIFEQQKAVLKKVEKDVREMPVVYTNRLNRHEDNTEENKYFIEQTMAMFDLLITFLSKYKNFMELLEQERLDFITLCQSLYPQHGTYGDEHITMLTELKGTYNKALSAMNASPTQPILSQESSQSTSTSSLNRSDKPGTKNGFSLKTFGKKKSSSNTSLPKIESKDHPVEMSVAKKEKKTDKK